MRLTPTMIPGRNGSGIRSAAPCSLPNEASPVLGAELNRSESWTSNDSNDFKRGGRNRGLRLFRLAQPLIRKRAFGEVRGDMKKCCAIAGAAGIVAVMSVLPADAHPKKQKRPAAQRYEIQTQTPSLDGRTLGRMRTCGFDYLQYDGLGTPYGPYCH
jgi:hypothetical protein